MPARQLCDTLVADQTEPVWLRPAMGHDRRARGATGPSRLALAGHGAADRGAAGARGRAWARAAGPAVETLWSRRPWRSLRGPAGREGPHEPARERRGGRRRNTCAGRPRRAASGCRLARSQEATMEIPVHDPRPLSAAGRTSTMKEPRMTLPGFSAEVSLIRTIGRYRRLGGAGVIGSPVIPAQLPGPIPPPVTPDLCQLNPGLCPVPSVNASWWSDPSGRGTLTVSGGGFPASTQLAVTVRNCAGFPYRQFVTTTPPALSCTNVGCFSRFGGDFQVTFPCVCGGDADVTADDGQGDRANATVPIPC